MLPYTSDNDLRVGDILVKGTHIEIYAGNGEVLNCGCQGDLGYVKTKKTIAPENENKIIRFK